MNHVAALAREYIHQSDHPDLQVYRRDFGEKFEMDQWELVMRRRCELAGFFNKRILEVGCGFGWDAVGLSLIGGNHVVATDILPSMIDGMTQCLQGMRRNGKELNVEAVQGDICNLQLPESSFDGIYSSEAVEHVHDLPAMFRRCLALLKPGGRMMIINDSNQFHTGFRTMIEAMWEERDQSWEHAEWLKTEIRPVEHADAKPYAAMREDIVRETDPDLSHAEVGKIAAATAGMIRRDIADAVAAYRADGSLPVRPRFEWCRNPETGEYAERLLDPFEVRNMIKEAGFSHVRLRHGFNKWPHRLLNGIAFRPLNKFLFNKRGLFIILAEKPA